MTLKPTMAYELFGGKVEVLIYGKSPYDFKEKHLFQIAHNLRLRHIYHPQTHIFNAKICWSMDFTKKIKIGEVKINLVQRS